MWGIIPAAGSGTRLQPLAFSKELLPVGTRRDAAGTERPRAVSEHLVERLLLAGVDRLCFVIAPGKGDILQYYGGAVDGVPICYVIQDRPAGLCDAVFRALPLVRDDEPVLVGLPDTIWFPADALRRLPRDRLAFLLFPTARPELFDAVDHDAPDAHGLARVRHIAVKQPRPTPADGSGSGEDALPVARPGASPVARVWGAFGMPGAVLHRLHALWQRRERRDEYVGTLVNAFLDEGGEAHALLAGTDYVDVGTVGGWREALRLLDRDRPA